MITVNKVTYYYKYMPQIRTLYNKSFPLLERIPFWMLMLRAKAKGIDFWAICDEEEFCGIIYAISYESITQILYLAIDTKLQSKGYGTKALELIEKQYNGNTIVLEVESTKEAADNFEQRNRRKRFYIRNGYEDSGYGVSINKVRYEILKSRKELELQKLYKLYDRIFFGIVKIRPYVLD